MAITPIIATQNLEPTLRLADGTAECMRAVREQLRRGARLIKVCASGGVLSELDSPIHQQFTGSELRTIVEVAGLAERVVAAHCHGKPGIMAAIEAGVATIEHGTFLDEEACDAMVESGTILVPTRSIVEDILKHLDDVGPAQQRPRWRLGRSVLRPHSAASWRLASTRISSRSMRTQSPISPCCRSRSTSPESGVLDAG